MSASVPMSVPAPVPLPWGRTHLRLLVMLNVLGAGFILLAWYWSAGRSEADTAPLNVAVLAMVVAGAANGAWLMRGRRAIGARRRAWLADLTGGSVPPARRSARGA